MRKLGYIQEFIGANLLKYVAKSVSRTKQLHNLETAKTIGILFDALDQQETKKIVDFADILIKQYNIRVNAIGFVSNVELVSAFHGQNGFKYYSKKDFNWYGIPTNVIVTDFIQEQFDILIDLHSDSYYHINYILKFAQSKCLVGRFDKTAQTYDIMIDIEKDKSIENFTKQILIYLHMIQIAKK